MDKLDALLRGEADNLRDLLEIPVSKSICPEVRLSKATSYFGLCEKNKVFKGRMYQFVITISEYILDDWDSVHQTMIHELLHTCPGCQNHGKQWKAYAAKVNKEWGMNIQRTGSGAKATALLDAAREEKVRPAYVVVCPDCGMTYERTRRSKLTEHPERYRCGICGSRLQKM